MLSSHNDVEAKKSRNKTILLIIAALFILAGSFFFVPSAVEKILNSVSIQLKGLRTVFVFLIHIQ